MNVRGEQISRNDNRIFKDISRLLKCFSTCSLTRTERDKLDRVVCFSTLYTAKDVNKTCLSLSSHDKGLEGRPTLQCLLCIITLLQHNFKRVTSALFINLLRLHFINFLRRLFINYLR